MSHDRATLLTAMVGTNAEQFPLIAAQYIDPRECVLDMTYGRGVFWSLIDVDYALYSGDKRAGVGPIGGMIRFDFRRLPFARAVFGAAVFDPPYMHGGATVKPSINDRYRNENASHESVIRLYIEGFVEAARVLKPGGRLIVKCQDEIESGRQHFSHIELIEILERMGFRILDLLVLVQLTVPAQREPFQKTARKNHSYWIVAEFRR